MKYIVRTQHQDNEFVIPIGIIAETPLEAARLRFNKQGLSSQYRTTALLVYRKDGYSNPQIFYVKHGPRVEAP